MTENPTPPPFPPFASPEQGMAMIAGLNARALSCLRVAALAQQREPLIVEPLIREAMKAATEAYGLVGLIGQIADQGQNLLVDPMVPNVENTLETIREAYELQGSPLPPQPPQPPPSPEEPTKEPA